MSSWFWKVNYALLDFVAAVSIFGAGANMDAGKIHYADRTRIISCAHTKGMQSGCRIRAYCAPHAVQLVDVARRKLITATMHRTQSTKETAINYFFLHRHPCDGFERNNEGLFMYAYLVID